MVGDSIVLGSFQGTEIMERETDLQCGEADEEGEVMKVDVDHMLCKSYLC